MSNCLRSTQPPKTFGFPRTHRLTRGDEIGRVGAQGKRIRTAHFEVRVLASPLLHPRVGFIVPKYGHSAVERNRLKRRLREMVRTRLLAELPAVDMVIRTKPSTYKAAFPALIEELINAVEKHSGSSR